MTLYSPDIIEDITGDEELDAVNARIKELEQSIVTLGKNILTTSHKGLISHSIRQFRFCTGKV